jgi:hypothetical protein
MPPLPTSFIVSCSPVMTAFVDELVILLCLLRAFSSISSLSRVALEGSPGSCSLATSGPFAPLDSIGLALDRVRARLLGGTVLSIEALVVCFRVRVLWDGESANSSPEASRDDGWRSATVGILFRFADELDEGDDMVGEGSFLYFQVRLKM